MSWIKLIHALDAEVCVLKAGSAHEEYRPNIPLPNSTSTFCSTDVSQRAGKEHYNDSVVMRYGGLAKKNCWPELYICIFHSSILRSVKTPNSSKPYVLCT